MTLVEPPFLARYRERVSRTWSDDTPIDRVRFVVLDSETTGLNPRTDRLITIGAVAVVGGEILLDGRPVTEQNRDHYRQLFSAVFSDFYLFENLLGLDARRVEAEASRYLQELHLDRKVKIRNGNFSTTALSQGQRKRLALLTAYLEDRPFYLFDEWASDQDPLFKNIFYTQILPALKARGKTALVISHDDRYFHLADRVLKLDYGKLVQDLSLPTPNEPLEATATARC